MIGVVLDALYRVKARFDTYRVDRRWRRLRALGMHIGDDVWLPASTWIDSSFCFLITIGDHCGFGEECLILAHDAQMDEFLDAARIGRVVIHESCHIGARSVILPGVEIGPRTIVGAHSVVSRSLPPDTVCAGSPAKVVCTLEEYLQKHRERIATSAQFPFATTDASLLTDGLRSQDVAAAARGPVYVTGGRSAELRGEGRTHRTRKPDAG